MAARGAAADRGADRAARDLPRLAGAVCADGCVSTRVLLQIASLAWNAAILPVDDRRALLDRAAETGLPGFEGEARGELQSLLANMIARKLALFDENKRFVLSVDLTGAEGGYLSVISTAARCAERD